jgi:tetratricopeptide (TPR) repeat protein
MAEMAEESAFLDGIACATKGDYAGAIACFDRVIAVAPYSAEAYYRRGLAYFDAGQWQQAAFDQSRAIEIDPDYRDALYARALTRVALDHFGGAIADLTHLLTLDPNHAAAYQLQATALRKQGKLDLALISLRKAAELYLDRRDVAAAKHCLDLLKQLQPKTSNAAAPGRSAAAPSQPAPATTPTADPTPPLTRPEAFYAALLTRAETGDALGALADLNWALNLDPQDRSALLCRAAVRIVQRDWQGAIADCNSVIQADPNHAMAYRYRARAKLELGDRAGSLVDLDRALALDADDPLLWVARGDAKQAAGDYLGAIADYDRALEQGGDRPMILVLRAKAAVRIEHLSQAIADYEQAASLLCDRNDWDRYRAVLEQLKRLQQSVPADRAECNASGKPQNPLWQRLLGRVGGQTAIAQTLIDRAREHYPGMDEDWYLEKVLYDLDRSADQDDF